MRTAKIYLLWPCLIVNIVTGHTSGKEVTECEAPLDIIFVLDSSLSISDSDWNSSINFIINTTRYFDIGLGEDQVRVGLVQYGTSAIRVWDLDDEHTSSQRRLQKEILKLSHWRQFSNTPEALEATIVMLTNSTGNRLGVENVVIIMSDGLTNLRVEELEYVANQLKNISETTIIAVASTNDTDQSKLLKLASTEEFVLSTQDITSVIDLLDGIRNCIYLSTSWPTIPATYSEALRPTPYDSTTALDVYYNESQSFGLNIIIGLVLGMFALVLMTGVCMFCCIRKRNKQIDGQLGNSDIESTRNASLTNERNDNFVNEQRVACFREPANSIYQSLASDYLTLHEVYARLSKPAPSTKNPQQNENAIKVLTHPSLNDYSAAAGIKGGKDEDRESHIYEELNDNKLDPRI